MLMLPVSLLRTSEESGKMLKLKANQSHPTAKKLERVIGLLENINLEFDWTDGVLKIRDTEFNVTFDLVDLDEGKPMGDMPPLFQYKLIRDKIPNRYCKCRHCDSSFGKEDAVHVVRCQRCIASEIPCPSCAPERWNAPLNPIHNR